jgi:hypothetical protein
VVGLAIYGLAWAAFAALRQHGRGGERKPGVQWAAPERRKRARPLVAS